MEYQKNNQFKKQWGDKPRFKKTVRPLGFHGYYVEVRDGEDPMRAYRKMKKWIKEDKFFETVKLRAHFRKPSEIRVEKAKERKRVLRKLHRDREGGLDIHKKRGR